MRTFLHARSTRIIRFVMILLGASALCLLITAALRVRALRDNTWQKDDAGRAAAMSARMASLPDSGRRTLNEADRMDAPIRELIERGGYRRAEALVQRQLETRQRWLGEEHEEVAASVALLGDIRYLRGDRPGAMEMRKRALAMRRRILGDRHPLVAESASALGRSLQASVRPAEAESLKTAALKLRRDLFGERSLPVAESLLDLGDFCRSRRQYDAALSYLERSLRVRRALLPPDSPEIAETLCNIGLVHLQRAQLRKAEPFLQEADRIAETSDHLSIESYALIESLYADALERRGDMAAAERCLESAIRAYEVIFREGLRGYPPSRGLADWWKLAALQIQQGHSEAAWASTERGLSRTLLDGLFPPDSTSTGSAVAGRLPWEATATDDPRFCTLAEVQRILPQDAAIVGWLERSRTSSDIVDYPYWGYVIRHSGPIEWRQIDAPEGAPPAASSPWIRDFTLTLYGAGEWPIAAPMKPEFREISRSACAERFDPLLPHLRGVRRLYIVRAGCTRRCPIEAMIDSTGASLGDRFEISYILSATMLVRGHEARPGGRIDPRSKVLFVGDAEGELRDQPAADAGLATDDQRVAKRAGQMTATRTQTPPLPGVRDEIGGIAPLFHNPTILLAGAHQEDAFADLAASGRLRDYRVIHIATHAEVPGYSPMESALIFSRPAAGAGTVGSTNGTTGSAVPRFLRPQEILRDWRLDADLVALSACRTGVGTWSPTEPMGGLCQALFLSGARCLLVSLWSVDDRATALFMERFYQNITGAYRDERSGMSGVAMSRPRALQEAKQWLRAFRDPDGSRPFESPAIWASFVLVGDPGDLGALDREANPANPL